MLEAYSLNPVNGEKKLYSNTEVDVIVGYNHEENCLAAVPLSSFNGKMTGVVHSMEGTRSEYSLMRIDIALIGLIGVFPFSKKQEKGHE